MVTNPSSLTTAEINALGTAFKVPQPVGSVSKTTMVFWTSSKPSKEIIIPQGTSVASADGMYVFTVTRTVRGIDASNASIYYDSNSGRYLIPVPVESIAASTAYNLPAYRITSLLGNVSGISGVYNPVPSTGGTDPYQPSDYLSNLQDAFAARDTASLGGFRTEIIRRGTSANFTVVDSTVRETFTRPVVGPAIDMYFEDAQENSHDEIFSSTGQSYVVPSMQPVLTVASVSVNGRQLDASAWSVDFDNSVNYGRSAKATTKINLPATTLSDKIRVTYTYAGSVQSLAQSLDDNDVLGVDVLPRLTRPIYISVQAYVACSSEMLSQVSIDLATFLTMPFTTLLTPDDAYNYVRTAFPEVTKITWINFSFAGSTGVSSLDIPVGYTPSFNSASDYQVSLARN
jgi:hypothetical protein